MFSAEGEKINFVENVNPVKKAVEDWMTEIEEMMKKSVRYELLKSIDEYKVFINFFFNFYNGELIKSIYCDIDNES